jgi:hypothetical protein
VLVRVHNLREGRGVERVRAAYHEAGHVVGWLSSPFELPSIYAVTIEPDRQRGVSGEVRHRVPPRFDARFHQLAVGRALARGKLSALMLALAAVSAELRAQAAGPVAEALHAGARLPTIHHGECDFWNAYELSATVGLDPERAWRMEARRARRWLRRRWSAVEHLAGLLLRRPAGRRMLAGAALTSVIDRARREVPPPFVPRCYAEQAQSLLAQHRARWRGREHWVVIEAHNPRGTAVAWAADEATAELTARELSQFAVRSRFDVKRRYARL